MSDGNTARALDPPGGGPRTIEQERLGLVAEIEAYLNDNQGASWNALAKHIGYSEGALNQWKNAKYAGDVAKINLAVAQFLERQSVRDEAAPALKRVSTWIFEEIYSAVAMTDQLQGLVVIAGDSGIGKTYALDQYIAGHKRRCLRTFADPSWHSMHGTLVGLYKELTGARNWSVNRDDVGEELLKRKKQFVVINDVHSLDLEARDMICAIAEVYGVGFALSGHPETAEQWKVVPTFGRAARARWQRITDRLFWCEIERPLSADKRKLLPYFRRADVAAIAKQILPDLNDDALDALCDPLFDLCNSLRALEKACQVARQIQIATRRPTGAELIRAAVKLRTPKPLRDDRGRMR